MVALRAITQEAFDDAVASNIEDFDMEEEEALANAIEEFRIQGVDLKGIVKRANRGCLEEHPVALATAKLKEARLSSSEEVMAAVEELLAALSCKKEDQLAEALTVAAKAGSVEAVLSRALGRDGSIEAVASTLQTLKLLLGADATRAAFYEAHGGRRLLDVGRQHIESSSVLEAAAGVAEAAATKHENNKTELMSAGIGALAVAALSRDGVTSGEVVAFSKALRRLTTADDDRPVVSRAFQNGRALASDSVHMALLAVLKRDSSPPVEVAAAACSAIKKVAVNDDICTEIADAGGVPLCLKVLTHNMGSASAVAAACTLLRQMAGNDPVKREIVQLQGMAVLYNAINAQGQNDAAMEQALGLVTALTLRFPEAAEEAVKTGLADAILQVMASSQGQWVQRQGCMALRNLVARNTELRPLLLEKGAEAALRRTKTAFPEACRDVGSAALRDLGIEDYNS